MSESWEPSDEEFGVICAGEQRVYVEVMGTPGTRTSIEDAEAEQQALVQQIAREHNACELMAEVLERALPQIVGPGRDRALTALRAYRGESG